ncbi:hypothetical protein BBJ28_00006486 [Nothophytophthora sp. Chile5]|nr:hypothetical protein BBJ28_00006486 [Nothophytophthora sp. Chile5]
MVIWLYISCVYSKNDLKRHHLAMDRLLPSFPAGCFVWVPWRRVQYLARVEDVREARSSGSGDVEILIHVHGEPVTKDKWLSVHRDGTPKTGTPPLRLVQELPTALTGIGSFPAAGDRVQLLVMDQSLVHRILHSTHRADEEVPTLVGVVVKLLPTHDASLVDVAYPADQAEDEAQWQRVQLGNGYVGIGLCRYPFPPWPRFCRAVHAGTTLCCV